MPLGIMINTYQGIDRAIGDSPLVDDPRTESRGSGVRIFAKPEYCAPGGSKMTALPPV
jgi:hypothetical protein